MLFSFFKKKQLSLPISIPLVLFSFKKQTLSYILWRKCEGQVLFGKVVSCYHWFTKDSEEGGC